MISTVLPADPESWHDGAMPNTTSAACIRVCGVTPAMEAGICAHVWSIEELCDLLPENHKIGVLTDKALILKALATSL